MKKHRLSLHKPQINGKPKVDSDSDPFLIYEFYDIVRQQVHELVLQSKPSHVYTYITVYNLDETSFFSDPPKHRLISLLGCRCCVLLLTRTNSVTLFFWLLMPLVVLWHLSSFSTVSISTRLWKALVPLTVLRMQYQRKAGWLTLYFKVIST